MGPLPCAASLARCFIPADHTTVLEQIITDGDIDTALKQYKKKSFAWDMWALPRSFRTRLNEASCSGCHQTRAIAGFHFPGEDRPGASPINAVYLPGSPHFFGDQQRRLEIVKAIADGKTSHLPGACGELCRAPLELLQGAKGRRYVPAPGGRAHSVDRRVGRNVPDEARQGEGGAGLGLRTSLDVHGRVRIRPISRGSGFA